MKVWFVGAGPGDPELLTRKAERLLRSAQVCVYAGSLVNPQLLEFLPAACRRHDSAKMTLEHMADVYREAQAANTDVIRLHSGESAIYGATAEQMVVLDALGIEYEVVPGISAFQAAAAALKKELTPAEISQTVIITRPSGRTPLPPEQELEKLAAAKATLCIYLGTPQLAKIMAQLTPFYGAACPAALIFHVSWPDQKVFTGTLATLADIVGQDPGITKTSLILVGWALGSAKARSKLYDGSFTHEYRKGTEA